MSALKFNLTLNFNLTSVSAAHSHLNLSIQQVEDYD